MLRILEAGGPEAPEGPVWEEISKGDVCKLLQRGSWTSALMLRGPGILIAQILQSVCAWKNAKHRSR